MTDNHLLNAALKYASFGWSIVPLHGIVGGRCTCHKRDCSSPGKHPRTKTGIKEATNVEEQIREWWGRWPGASIGLACGELSNIWVLDIDAKAPKPRKDERCISGLVALEEFEKHFGELPHTLESGTGGGGRHLFYRLPADRLIKNRVSVQALGGGRTGLDVRSTGGYVVLPPSPHASGGTYEWRHKPKVADAPDWLLDLVAPPEPEPAAAPAPPPRLTLDGSRERAYVNAALANAAARIQQAGKGDRHSAILYESKVIGGYVAAGYLQIEEARAILEAAGTAAGKSMREVRRTVRDGLNYGAQTPRHPQLSEDTNPTPPRPPRPDDFATQMPEPPDIEMPPPPDDEYLGVYDDDDEHFPEGQRPPAKKKAVGSTVDLDELRTQAGWKTKEVPDNLPEISVTNRQGRRIIDDAWRAVHATNSPPSLFVRGGYLVEVRKSAKGDHIVGSDQSMIEGRLMRSARWVRQRKATAADQSPRSYVYIDAPGPPSLVARDMLAYPEPLPELDRVVYAPIFDDEGFLLSSPGYHPSARVWYDQKRRITPIDYTVEEAVQLLLTEWLGDFPFAGPCDEAHALGLFLLPFVRELIVGETPLHLIEAPTVGSGKSLLARILCDAASGHDTPSSPWDPQETERKKAITSALAAGRPIIFYDNLKGKIESSALENALTSPRWCDRVLGESMELNVPQRAVWVATANNATMSIDMARRTVRIRIDPGVERPYERTGWRHKNIVQWTHDHHSELVSAAVTLISHWMSEGRPGCSRDLGSYAQWAAVVGGIVEAAGVSGFLEARDEWLEDADPSRGEWSAFFRAWYDEHGAAELQSSVLRDMVLKGDYLETVLASSKSDRARATKIGLELKAMVYQVVGQFRLRARTLRGVKVYRLEKVGGRHE